MFNTLLASFRCVRIVTLAICLALVAGVPLQSAGDDKKPDEKKADDKKPDPKKGFEEFGKKMKEIIEAGAPPTWKARADLQGDALPTGAVARLGTSRFRHGSAIPCVAYSPDGKLLATGGSDNHIRLFDATSGTLVRELAGHQASTFVMPEKAGLADFGNPTGKSGLVTTLAFSPDSKLLASGGWDDAVRLWDVSTGKQVHFLDAHKSSVSAVAFSKDGKVLASRGGLDGVVRLWDPITGKELHKFDKLPIRSAALAFAPDSKTVAIGDGKAISLRDVESGKETGQIQQAGTLCLAYSEDGKHLAAGGRDSTLRIWDVAAGKEVQQCQIPKKEPPSRVAFSPDGKLLAAAIKENSALIFDVATGKPAHVLPYYWPDTVAYAPDGKSVAFAGDPAAVRLWDPATGKELAIEPPAHQSAVTHLVVSGDGKTVASGGDHLHIWDGITGKHVRRIDIPRQYVEALALSPDGQTLATGGRDKVVHLWDVGSGKETQQFKHEGTLRALAFSPDGTLLASGDLQLNVHVWDLANKKEVHKIKVPATFTDRLALAFSPDSKVLACGGALNADWPRGIPSTDPYGMVLALDKGYPVLLWDAQTGKELGRLEGANSRLRCVGFAPDGKTLAASSSDGRITLWDTGTKKERLSIVAHPDNLDSVFKDSPTLTFTPDSQTLVSASSDKTLRLWDATTGQELGRLETPSRTYAVALSKDGKVLLTGQADSGVLAWDLSFLASSKPRGKRNFSIGHIDLR